MKKALKRLVREEIMRDLLITVGTIIGVFVILYLVGLLHPEL